MQSNTINMFNILFYHHLPVCVSAVHGGEHFSEPLAAISLSFASALFSLLLKKYYFNFKNIYFAAEYNAKQLFKNVYKKWH